MPIRWYETLTFWQKKTFDQQSLRSVAAWERSGGTGTYRERGACSPAPEKRPSVLAKAGDPEK